MSRMTHLLFGSGLALAGAIGAISAPAASAATLPVSMKVLIVANDGNESDLPAITNALAFIGIPYAIYLENNTPGGLTSQFLSNSTQGFYQGVITTGSDVPLTTAETQALQTYEANFNIRQVNWYVYPQPNYGFQWPTGYQDTSQTPLTINFASGASQVFKYVNRANPVSIQGVYAYFAQPLNDGASVPLLADSNGNTMVLLRNNANGTQQVSLAFDSNPYYIHTLTLAYDLVNWVTQGLYLGARHTYCGPQVDDIFIANYVYPTEIPIYRITGADLGAFVAWQFPKLFKPLTTNFVTTLAINGIGTTHGYYDSDTYDSLSNAVRDYGIMFNWMSHTYDHSGLDAMDYSDALAEFTKNSAVAQNFWLFRWMPSCFVPPGYTGFTNPAAMQAEYDAGIRYVVCDASIPAYDNPAPNAGIYNPLQPSILMMPRHPNSLYLDSGTPASELAEYNYYHTGNTVAPPVATYAQFLDAESNRLLVYLLQGEYDPWMFHEHNLQAYDGVHSLLGDLLDATIAKYSAIYSLPILSPAMNVLGQTMAEQMAYNAAGVTSTYTPGVSLVITAQSAARVPVSGLYTQGCEVYGGTNISYFNLAAGQTKTIKLDSKPASGALGLSASTVHSDPAPPAS